MSKHTPAPWKAEPHGDGWHITAATGPYTRIATFHGMRGANAKLGAAAPELLEALRNFVAFAEYHELSKLFPRIETQLCVFRGVIATAEGRS